MTVVLISCGAAKLDHPAAARDLYTGSLFRAARGLAERSGLPWGILSARHGFVRPDAVLAPYDQRLPTGQRDRERWASLAVGDIDSAHGSRTPVVLLAGADYTRPVMAMCNRERVIVTPLGRMELGARLHWLTRATGADLERAVNVRAAEIAERNRRCGNRKPTQRDPGLPPARPGLSDGGVGGADPERR